MDPLRDHKLRFETRPGFKTVGMMIESCADTGEIPALWDKFARKMGSIPNRINKEVCYGVINPYGAKAEKETIDYVAAVEVENFDDVPDDMVSSEIPEAFYAVFTHKGPINKFMETIQFVYGEWLPNSGYKQSGTPDFELYNEKFNPVSDDSECYIYLPVEKK